MTVSQARLMLASLPEDSELVLSCCSPMYSQVRGFVVRDAHHFNDGSFWRINSATKALDVNDTYDMSKTKIVEVEFERSR